MADKQINQLVAASTINDDDLFVLQQGGTAKKLTGAKLGDYVYNAAAEKIEEVNEAVAEAQAAVDQLIEDKNEIAEAVASMAQLGTDTSLTTLGMAADAGATGKVRDDLEELEKTIWGTYDKKTASGSIVSFNDGAANVPLDELVAGISPVQDLHGYDNPWPGGAKANIWDEEWESGDYSYTTGDKHTSGNYWRSKNYIPITPSTSYYVKSPYYIDVLYYGENKEYLGQSAMERAAQNEIITSPSNAYYIRICSGTSGHPTYTNNVAINYPSSVTNYSPYSNVCPISGWTGCNLFQSEYNMLNQDDLIKASGWAKSADSGFVTYGDKNAQVYKGEIVQLYNKYKSNSLLPIKGAKAGKRYVIGYSWRSVGVSTSNGIKFEVWYTDGTGSGVTAAQTANQTWTQTVVVTPANKIPAGIAFTYNSTYTIYMAGLMCVEYDNYMSIVGDKIIPNDLVTYSISFGSAGTVYGGTLTVHQDGTGALVVDRARKIFTGEEAFSDDGSGGNKYFRYKLGSKGNVYGNLTSLPPICSHFKNADIKGATTVTGFACVVSSAYNGDMIFFRPENISSMTIEQFTTLLTDWYNANTPCTVIYPVKTPAEYTLTAEQVRTLLGQNNIWADTGDISLTYSVDPQSQYDDMVAKVDSVQGMIAEVEEGTTASRNYTVGDRFVFNNQFCKATTAIVIGEAFNTSVSGNCEVITVDDELDEVADVIDALDAGDIGYSESATYAAGTVGAEVGELKSALQSTEDYALAAFPQETLTDQSIASFGDGADNVPIKELMARIEPVQSGTGDPSPDNVRPISGHTECNIHTLGSNWIDEGYIFNANNYTVAGQYSYTYTPWIYLKPNTTYYYKPRWNNNALGDVDLFVFSVPLTNSNPTKYIVGNSSGQKNAGGSFTTGSTGRIRFGMHNFTAAKLASVKNALDSLMFNLGSTALPYEPYQGTTKTITFTDGTDPLTVYGGTLTVHQDWTGTLVVDRATITLDGQNSLGAPGSTDGETCTCRNTNLDFVSVATTPDGLSDMFSWVINNLAGAPDSYPWKASNYYTTNQLYFVVENSVVGITQNMTRTEKSAAINQYFALHPATVLLPLATPTTYTLTAEQVGVITTLYGINNVWADCGNVDITYRTWNNPDVKLRLTKALIAPVLDSMTADTILYANDFRIVDNTLYRITKRVASGGTLTPGTNCTATTLGAEITAILNT